MVSTSLALAVQHFCVGRRLPNLHLSMPTAGPGTGLAHTGDAGLFGGNCVADIMLCCVLFEMQMRRWRSPLSFHHFVFNRRKLTFIEPSPALDTFMNVISFILRTDSELALNVPILQARQLRLREDK